MDTPEPATPTTEHQQSTIELTASPSPEIPFGDHHPTRQDHSPAAPTRDLRPRQRDRSTNHARMALCVCAGPSANIVSDDRSRWRHDSGDALATGVDYYVNLVRAELPFRWDENA
ncbi:hypothetical protein Q0Z83_027940 [Actinoplanes sichuanensis]|nr:hypothetical protein Q0Z83_027940 [Actinoplanes sichuanensis]